MLLFLLSFYLHYVLLTCDEIDNTKFNELLLLDKHHQNLLQVNAFLKDVQQNIHEKSVLIVDKYGNETIRNEEFVNDSIIDWGSSKAPEIDRQDQNPKDHEKLPAVFYPSSQYDPSDHRQGLFQLFPPAFSGFKLPLPPVVIPRPSSSPYSMGLSSLTAGRRPPYPRYLLRPVHSLYPSLPPKFLSDYRYQNIYLRPGPYINMPSPSYTPGPTRPKGPLFLYAVDNYLQKNTHLLNPFHPTISPPIFDLAISSKNPPLVAIPSSTIGHNARIWLKEIAPYTPVNEKFKNHFKHQFISNRISEKNDYWFSIETADTGLLFNEDEHGNVTLPEKDGKTVNVPNDPTKNRTTTAGDVLDEIMTQKPLLTLKQRYLNLIEQLDEGYMMVFTIELCRIIGVKDSRDVEDVLYHTEMIHNSLWDNGRLDWIGEPLETVIRGLSIRISGRDIELVRTYSSMVFHMLLQRKQALSAEVNSIIDEADSFYNHDAGDRLIYSLQEFEDYPNTTKNSYWLCDSLIESFLLPFRRLSGRRQRLIDSINKVLKQRFPLLLREHNEGTLAGEPNNQSHPRKRKRKRYHILPKMKRERKRHHTLEKIVYGKQYSQDIDYKESVMRTMTRSTSDQPMFRVATSKGFRKKNRRRPLHCLLKPSDSIN